MPTIKARPGKENSKTCTVKHKNTKIRYSRPRDSELQHLGRSLEIEVEGNRGAAKIILKGREINSLKKMLERVGELSG